MKRSLGYSSSCARDLPDEGGDGRWQKGLVLSGGSELG